MAGLRDRVKRVRTLHSAYKLAASFRQVPPSEWARLRRTAAIFRVLPNTMLSAGRLMNAYDSMETVERERLRGAVAECGVWAGGAIGLMASVSKRHGNHERCFHLFDSFEGLPQPSVHDMDVVGAFRDEHPDLAPDDGSDPDALVAIGACASPLEQVRELFDDVLEIDRRQVVIHQGWFQETVAAAATTIGELAILRIDGDWYESTKVCLEGLYDNVVEGGFVIIDDYGYFSGCRKAVDEFFAARGVVPHFVDIDGEGVYLRKPVARPALAAVS
jgi:hypothetical protein